MRYLSQFLIILGFTFAGEVLSRLIPLPIPAAVYGLVLLFLALHTGMLKLERVQAVGNWLIGLMPLLFVAPVVNLLGSWQQLKENLIPIAVITLVSTVAVFAIAGKLTQWLRKKGENKNG